MEGGLFLLFIYLFIYSLTLGSLILLQNLIHSRGGGVPKVGPGRISAGLPSRWKCPRENGLERNEKVGSTNPITIRQPHALNFNKRSENPCNIGPSGKFLDAVSHALNIQFTSNLN